MRRFRGWREGVRCWTQRYAAARAHSQYGGRSVCRIAGEIPRQSRDSRTSFARIRAENYFAEFNGARRRAVDVRHNAVEEMHKSAEWYEKKAQTQIVGLTERAWSTRAISCAKRQARSRASSRRNWIIQAGALCNTRKRQMEEVVREAFDRARAFSQKLPIQRRRPLRRNSATGPRRAHGLAMQCAKRRALPFAQIQASRAEIAQQTTAEQEEFLQRFRGALSARSKRDRRSTRESAEDSRRCWNPGSRWPKRTKRDVETTLWS